MTSTDRLFVISDVHLADATGSGLFDAAEELAQFLAWVKPQVPAHLVLAGDFFEFLSCGDPAAVSPAAFDPYAAPTRMKAILDTHPDVFSTLAEIAATRDLTLTVMGGNHDLELAFPEVRQPLEKALGRDLSWRVHGEALRIDVGSCRVLIEHGDLFDDWNRVDHGPLVVAVRLASRKADGASLGFTPPAGSGIVTRFVEKARRDHPWIGWIKPEKEALVPILHYLLEPRDKLRLLGVVESALRGAAKGLMARWLRSFAPDRLTRASAEAGRQSAFARWIDETKRADERGPSKDGRRRLVKRLRRVAGNSDFFDVNTCDQTLEHFAHPPYRDVDLVIHGHTHAAKMFEIEKHILFANSGTWCPLVPLPGKEESLDRWLSFVDALENNTIEPSPRFTFIQVDAAEAGAATAALRQWSDGGPLTLAERVCTPPGLWENTDD